MLFFCKFFQFQLNFSFKSTFFFSIEIDMFDGKKWLSNWNNGFHYQFDATTNSEILYLENYVKISFDIFIV